MTKMFRSITRTWNPFTGCSFFCSYCWARQLVETRLAHTSKYREQGFKPSFHPKELIKNFKPGDFVFIASMGDISFSSRDKMAMILQRVREFPETRFLLQTKNPLRFFEWQIEYPPNIYLGTTIESNRDYGVSKAPPPQKRFEALSALRHPHKFLSIEPLMDFDLDILVSWITDEIQPDIVEVGADNYGHNLPEPSAEKVHELLRSLRQICPRVEGKDGLGRLMR